MNAEVKRGAILAAMVLLVACKRKTDEKAASRHWALKDMPALEPCSAEHKAFAKWPACERDPAACRVNATLLTAGGHRQAYRIVFVPVGFDRTQIEGHRILVRLLVDQLRSDSKGLVGRRPEMFDFFSVEDPVPILSDACRAEKGTIDVDRRTLADIGRAAIPNAFVVVAFVNAASGRSNAAVPENKNTLVGAAEDSRALPRSVVALAVDRERVVDHELGHAIAGLEDEYDEREPGACTTRTPPFATKFSTGPVPLEDVNLSRHADGREWTGLVAGAQAGGGSDFAWGECLFHPTTSCRMLTIESESYCPVCNAEIDRVLAGRAGEILDTPECVLEVDQDPAHAAGTVHVQATGMTHRGPLRIAITMSKKGSRQESSDEWRGEGRIRKALFTTVSEGEWTVSAECSNGEGRKATATVSLVVKKRRE